MSESYALNSISDGHVSRLLVGALFRSPIVKEGEAQGTQNMENSNINWTENTINFWIGCRHVSAECDHCYADTWVTKRMGRDFSAITRTKTWKEPHKWNRKAPALSL